MSRMSVYRIRLLEIGNLKYKLKNLLFRET